MGLKEIIANKKLKNKLSDLYCGITDSFVDITERVQLNKLTKSAGMDMLQVVCDSGKDDYAQLKSNNPNAEELFIESDKKFNSLFKDIESTIETYGADIYSL